MSSISSIVRNFLNSGSKRTVGVKKNVVLMFLIKGVSILISFVMVPLTINYVKAETYGLWITISSVVAWISYFDIGLNNGLRNKFAEAKALDDVDLGHRYVSTTYAMLILIFFPVMIIFLIINPFVDWTSVFHVSRYLKPELTIVMAIVVSFFCLKFILSTINMILSADQRPAESSARQLCENALSLIVIFILTRYTKGSLLNLSLALCLSPIIILVLFTFILFNGRYKYYVPTIASVDFKLLPSLFGLGLKFFIIQISSLIIFQTSSIIIQREFGGVQVTAYNIAYKYFGILTMVINILMFPIWSASTDAYAREDYQWIRDTMKTLRKIFFLLVLCGLLMLAISPFVYKIWIGKSVEIPFLLSIGVLCYCLVLTYGSIYVFILNGIGALRIQFYTSLVAPLLYVLSCVICIKVFHWGIYSIVVASIISYFNGFIIAPIQFHKIFVEGKKGVWIR